MIFAVWSYGMRMVLRERTCKGLTGHHWIVMLNYRRTEVPFIFIDTTLRHFSIPTLTFKTKRAGCEIHNYLNNK